MDDGSVTTWKLHPKGIAVDIRYMHTRVHDDRMIHGKQGGTALTGVFMHKGRLFNCTS